jgi:hypothetical protein
MISARPLQAAEEILEVGMCRSQLYAHFGFHQLTQIVAQFASSAACLGRAGSFPKSILPEICLCFLWPNSFRA